MTPDDFFKANHLFDSGIQVVLLDLLDDNGWEGFRPERIESSGGLTPNAIPLNSISTLQFVIDALKLASHNFIFFSDVRNIKNLN